MRGVRRAALLFSLAIWPSAAGAQVPLPPPPPPPPPVLVHANVWFQLGSAEPMPAAGIDPIGYWGPRMVDPAITIITVDGHADTAGPSELNMELSEQRARRVAELLVTHGAPAEKIILIACGEARLSKPTLDGVPERLNRVAGFNWNSRQEGAPPTPIAEPINEGCRTSRFLAD